MLNSKEGYTLVELITAVGIIVIVSGMIAGVLYSTLRDGNKTKVTNDVSQNGNYALSVISNTILNSASITQVGATQISDCTASPTGTSIYLEQSDGLQIEFACMDDSIASISGDLTTYLVNNNLVKVSSCNFKCRQSNGNPYALPIVDVSFTVSQKNADATSENKASTSVSTSVTMRNFNPK
jgi:type II secretory pathway pseudopilin PulG